MKNSRIYENGKNINGIYSTVTGMGCRGQFNKNGWGNNWKKYGKICKVNDIIIMTYDTEKQTLTYMINDKDYGIKHDNIPDGEYRFICSAKAKPNELEFL